MKPIPVKAGEHSEIGRLLDKALQLEKAVEESGNNDVFFEDVSGTNVRAQHYWTNGEVPPVPDTVQKKVVMDKNPPGLNYHESANPHQTGSTLGMHLIDGKGDSAALKKSKLLGAWHEDNPFGVEALVKKVEELSHHL